jgi:hypothetical protein
MKTVVFTPVAPPAHGELGVVYVVVRADGQSKKFETLGPDATRNHPAKWEWGAHMPSPASLTVPVDPWTAIKTGMCTFEELQLPEGAKALFNLI